MNTNVLCKKLGMTKARAKKAERDLDAKGDRRACWFWFYVSHPNLLSYPECAKMATTSADRFGYYAAKALLKD